MEVDDCEYTFSSALPPALVDPVNNCVLSDAESSEVEVLVYADPRAQDLPQNMSAIVLSLFKAATNGNEELLRQILAGNINVNSLDRCGCTPLHRAVESPAASPGIVDTLLQHGAKCNKRNKFGDTPLHYAVRNSPEVVSRLVNSTANVNAVNNVGETPLHQCQSLEVARILIKAGANINQQNNRGNSVLMQMAFGPDGKQLEQVQPKTLSAEERVALINLFLEFKADLSLRNAKGQTAMGLAVKAQHLEVMKILGEASKQIVEKALSDMKKGSSKPLEKQKSNKKQPGKSSKAVQKSFVSPDGSTLKRRCQSGSHRTESIDQSSELESTESEPKATKKRGRSEESKPASKRQKTSSKVTPEDIEEDRSEKKRRGRPSTVKKGDNKKSRSSSAGKSRGSSSSTKKSTEKKSSSTKKDTQKKTRGSSSSAKKSTDKKSKATSQKKTGTGRTKSPVTSKKSAQTSKTMKSMKKAPKPRGK